MSFFGKRGRGAKRKTWKTKTTEAFMETEAFADFQASCDFSILRPAGLEPGTEIERKEEAWQGHLCYDDETYPNETEYWRFMTEYPGGIALYKTMLRTYEL